MVINLKPQSNKILKYEDNSWDYRKADTKYSVHGLHPYPAMMIPQVAKRLILKFSKPGEYVLDPFCGSGTVLVESKINNRNSVGIDINPLALLIAKVKTAPLKPAILKERAKDLIDFIYTNSTKPEIPDFFNIDYWFKPQVIQDLAKIRLGIFNIEEKDIRDFFLVCFSVAVRIVSNTKNSEFKLYRINSNKLATFNPNTFKVFSQIVYQNIKKMEYFYEHGNNGIDAKIYLADTRESTPLPDNHFNLLVTSPPYGDSKTTVAYGQFSRLSMQWIGIKEKEKIDKESLGGVAYKDLNCPLNSEILKEIIEKIAREGKKRAREVLSFYIDLNKTLKEISRVMKINSHICFVIGNRTVKGIRIPTDEILIELFKEFGFNHLETIVRNIPNKTMPLQNSPSNIKGKIQDTMHKENIVIMKKVS
jgi:site-specific DNA-methyltransferase (cytosine-N4-specific)